MIQLNCFLVLSKTTVAGTQVCNDMTFSSRVTNLSGDFQVHLVMLNCLLVLAEPTVAVSQVSNGTSFSSLVSDFF